MRRSLLAALTVVATVTLVLTSLAPVFAQDDLQPSIHIPQLRHDFGEIFERDKYEYSFVVMNRGKADLVIENVKPG
jgi:hypothetical protein